MYTAPVSQHYALWRYLPSNHGLILAALLPIFTGCDTLKNPFSYSCHGDTKGVSPLSTLFDTRAKEKPLQNPVITSRNIKSETKRRACCSRNLKAERTVDTCCMQTQEANTV